MEKNISGIKNLLSLHIRAIDQWVENMGVDFTRMGSQQDDMGIFPPELKKSDAWWNYNFDAEPRYNLDIAYKTLKFIVIAVISYMAGFPKIVNFLPYLAVFVIFAGVNWLQLLKGFALSVVFFFLQYYNPLEIAGPDMSILITVLLFSVWNSSLFIRYYMKIAKPGRFIDKQKKELKRILSILWIIRFGNESLKSVSAIAVPPDENASVGEKEKMLKDFIKEVVKLVDENAKDYVVYTSRFYRKDYIDVHEFKEHLVCASEGRWFELLKDLDRPVRARNIKGGELHESGNIGRSDRFGATMDGAISQIQKLLQKEHSESDMDKFKSVYGMIVFIPAVIIVLLLAAADFSFPVKVFSVFSVYVFALGLFSVLLGSKVKNHFVLIYPAKDMRGIYRDYQRLIYSTDTHENLKAIDVRRFLIQIRAALYRLKPHNLNRDSLQRALDIEIPGMENMRDTGIVRNFLNAFHLTRIEKIPFKIFTLSKTVLFLTAVGFVFYLTGTLFIALVTAAYNLLSTGNIGTLFQKGFAVFEAVRLNAEGYPFWSPEVGFQLFIFILQICFGILMVGSATLFIGKFSFYYLGRFAKLYLSQKTRNEERRKHYITSIAVCVICLFLLMPAVGVLALTVKMLFAAEIIRAMYMLIIVLHARHRFKAICEDDKLYEGADGDEREKSFRGFVDTLLGRIEEKDRDLIILANKLRKEDPAGWKERLSNRQKMRYEKLFGKGAGPSGSIYEMIDYAGLKKNYDSLGKNDLLERMSCPGFDELKVFLREKGISLDTGLKLWKAQKDTDKYFKNVTADEIRSFLEISHNEKKIIFCYDIIPRMTPWIVAVGSEETVFKLIKSLLAMRYPLKKVKFIFAGENWSKNVLNNLKVEGVLPEDEIFIRGMAVREDGRKEESMPENIKHSGFLQKLHWLLFVRLPKEPSQPYTKPGANTSVLHESDGIAGIIYDVEDIPNQNQLLQFILGTSDGILNVRKLVESKIAPQIEKAAESLSEKDAVGTTLKKTSGIIESILRLYGNLLKNEDKVIYNRFNFKRGRVLARHMRYFCNNTLKSLLEITSGDRRYFSTAMLWEKIKRLDAEVNDRNRPVKKTVRTGLRKMINLYVTLCNMPGYGVYATDYIMDRITFDRFVKSLIIAEYKRINEPRNGQGRLAKITNALHAAKGQISAFMFGEYASWYTAGWDGLHASNDAFKPLGGTTGYFSTEPVEEIDWKDKTVSGKLNIEGESKEIEHHYNLKNSLLTLGGWDEFQVAEDYMLGLVLWWYGFNVSGFWSLTPEDPSGFESEVGFKFRPKQMSRWMKGYIMGLIIVTENWGNFSELWKRKGLWGYATFCIPTLFSAVQPFLFRVARMLCIFWWIYFIPVKSLWEMALSSRIAPIALFINGHSSIVQFLERVRKTIGIYTPTVLNFFSVGGWAWVIGPCLILIPIFIYRYFTMRGVKEGVDDYLGLRAIIDEYDNMIDILQSRISSGCSSDNRALLNALKEMEKRKRVVAEGSLEEAAGVVSARKFLLAIGLFMGSCFAILVSGNIFRLFIFTGVFSFIIYCLTMMLGHIYINAAGNQVIKGMKEKAVRAMRFRAAIPNFFIDFYHMLYIAGNKIAWQEVIKGANIGYWWRTPRAVDILNEVVERNEKKLRKTDISCLLKEKLSGFRSWFIYEDIERSIEKLRLDLRLYRNYGFMLLMTWVLMVGLRFGFQVHLFNEMVINSLVRGRDASYTWNLVVICSIVLVIIAWKSLYNFRFVTGRWKEFHMKQLWVPGQEPKIRIVDFLDRLVTATAVFVLITILAFSYNSYRIPTGKIQAIGLKTPLWALTEEEKRVLIAVDIYAPGNFNNNIGFNIKGSFHDVGFWPGHARAGWATGEGAMELENRLREEASRGSKLVRYMPVLGDLRSGAKFDDGYITFDKSAEDDIAVFFAIVEKVRHDYPDLKVIPVLLSFQIADGTSVENGITVGEYPELFTRPELRARFIDEIDRLFSPYWDNEAVFAWDLFNEPELTIVDMDDIRSFVRESALRIRNKGGKVTLGSNTVDDMLALWVGSDLDILQFHFYREGSSSLPDAYHIADGMDIAIDKPVFVGEWGVRDSAGAGREADDREVDSVLTEAKEYGYIGLLLWQDDYYGVADKNSLQKFEADSLQK